MPREKMLICDISIWPPQNRDSGGVTDFFKGPLIRARDKDILHKTYMSLNLPANKNIGRASIICTFGGTYKLLWRSKRVKNPYQISMGLY